MKATNKKKIEIAKDIARKLEKQCDDKPDSCKMIGIGEKITVNKYTLKELCKMMRRIKNEEEN